MADSNIGALPLAPDVADDSLLVMEQQGAAMKLTGGMLKNWNFRSTWTRPSRRRTARRERPAPWWT